MGVASPELMAETFIERFNARDAAGMLALYEPDAVFTFDGVPKAVGHEQIAGALARRIKWYVKEGQPMQQGDEFGFIKFGSRVDIFLPLTSNVLVKVGDITKGGKTVIAEL